MPGDIDETVHSLRDADDVRSLWEACERRLAEGDAVYLGDLGVALTREYESVPDGWQAKSVFDRLLRLLAGASGPGDVRQALRLVAAKRSVGRPVDRYAASLLASFQAAADLVVAFPDSAAAGIASDELRACLVQELVLRGALVDEAAPIAQWVRSAGRKHPLSWLPLVLDPLEEEPDLPTYGVSGEGTSLPYWPSAEGGRAASPGDARAAHATETTTDDVAEAMAAAVQNWVEESNGSAEARVFGLDRAAGHGHGVRLRSDAGLAGVVRRGVLRRRVQLGLLRRPRPPVRLAIAVRAGRRRARRAVRRGRRPGPAVCVVALRRRRVVVPGRGVGHRAARGPAGPTRPRGARRDGHRLTGEGVMGYDLHITRADHWPDSPMYPISYEEWAAVADAEPALTQHPVEGHHPGYVHTGASGASWSLTWREGYITIWKGYGASAELAAVAAKLGARLVGDDSEEYHPDGTHTSWTEPRPVLFDRPLFVDEVAPAWREIFDRDFDEGLSWRPAPGHALHALSSFRKLAARAVATADVADADGLRYRASTFGPADERVLRVQLVRQLATDPDYGITLVECRLDFALDAELDALGATLQRWFPADGPTRDEWFDAVAARPEWAVLDRLAPVSVTFETIRLG